MVNLRGKKGMRGKKIVVTGGAGFIGSNLTETLSKDNQVIVIDDLSTGYLKNIQHLVHYNKVTFVQGNITDLSFLQQTFNNIDYVFHQAAIPSVPRSIKDPLASTRVNLNGTLNVLLAARDNGVQKVVYASSSSVYGDTPTLPKTEDMKPCPLSPYAISKLGGEYFCQVFTLVYDMPVVALRYFNVYGPRQDPKSEYAAVIPKFITNITSDKPPLIYGNGEQTRDFTYVKDVVKANILAAEGTATGVFNIANGNRITINKLASTIMDLFGKQLQSEFLDPRPGDILHSHADISKAKEKLHFQPDYDLVKGLKETVQWFQS
jgi:UDP-glucose 4-epimerase